MEPWIPPLFGAFFGFLSAVAFGTIVRWRESEKSRSEIRALLSLLIIEVGHRREILNDNYAGINLGDYGSAVKEINYRKSGVTFDYTNELLPYRFVFDQFKDKLLLLRTEISTLVLEHYLSTDETIQAHVNYLNPPMNDREKAHQTLSGLRENITKLLNAMETERTTNTRRLFLIWLPLWIVGQA